jgi:hypothetical protein
MHSTLVITDAADSLALLTEAELREAAGVSDDSQDTALAAMGLRVAAVITSECNVAVGRGSEPTLLQETLTETFRLVSTDALRLSRRFEVDVDTLTEDDVVLVEDTDFLVDQETGLITRLCSDWPVRWCAEKIVVVYDAGFSEVPDDLANAAMDLVKIRYLEQTRNPLVKSLREDIPGVAERETDYWVGAMPGQSNGAIPVQVSGQLKRFRNGAFG